MGSSSPNDQTRPTLPAHRDEAVTLPGHPASQHHGSGSPDTAVTVPAGAVPSGGAHDVLTGQQWGDFSVGTLLGRGGMGSVYRGRQISLDREVAIKVLPPHLSENQGFRSRFQLEAKAVARLDSPNIIKVYGAGETNGHHYFAMEYVEGDDLAVTVRRSGKPTRQQSLGWVLQAARGLQAAGELGIVHRDIKPANMMLTKKGVVKLMDFGLVKQGNDSHGGLTMTGTVMGTVSYFSPEQGRGERCDSRTDLYALGIVLYEFLTGKLPFTGEDATSIIYQHIHVTPVPPREIDPAITEDCQAVCLKCLQKNTSDRYQSATELVADLERLVRGDRPDIDAAEMERLKQGTTMYVPGRRDKNSSRLLAPLIIAAVTVSIAAATAVWLSRTTRPEVPTTPADLRSPSSPPIIPVLTSPAPVLTPPAHVPPAHVPPAHVPPVHVPPVHVPPVVKVPGNSEPQSGPETTARPTPPNLPTVPTSSAHPPAGPGLASVIQSLCVDNRFTEARSLVATEQAKHPNDTSLNELPKMIESAEGATLISRARANLAKGDLEGASHCISGARGLLGTTLEVTDLTQELKRRKDSLQSLLNAALAQATAGNVEAANSALEQARKDAPEAPEIAVADQAVRSELARQAAARAARDEALTAGSTALAALDLDRAETAFKEAARIDPLNQAAAAGSAAVIAKRNQLATLYKAVIEAVAERNLAAANQANTQLTTIAPLHPATTEANGRVATLREELIEEKRAADALEAQRVARATTLLQRCSNLEIPISVLEAELAAFLREAGNKRPERSAIELCLADRREREAVDSMLSLVDLAVLEGDAKVLNALVTDTAHATALAGLANQPGLVFVTSLTAFERSTTDANKATATVHIRHALTTFPETILIYTCDLERTTSGWIITAVRRSE